MPLTLTIWQTTQGSAAHLETPNRKHYVFNLANSPDFSPLAHRYTKLRKFKENPIDFAVISNPRDHHLADICDLHIHPSQVDLPWHLPLGVTLEENFNDPKNGQENYRWDREHAHGMKETRLRAYRELAGQAGPESMEQDHHRSHRFGPPSAAREKDFQHYRAVRQEYDCPPNRVREIGTPEQTQGVSVQTYHPWNSPIQDIDGHSIVSIINYGGLSIVLPGDNTPGSWAELFAETSLADDLNHSYILLAPGQGHPKHFPAALFQHRKPMLTIISDGVKPKERPTHSLYGEITYRTNPEDDKPPIDQRYAELTRGTTVAHHQTESTSIRKVLNTWDDGHIIITADLVADDTAEWKVETNTRTPNKWGLPHRTKQNSSGRGPEIRTQQNQGRTPSQNPATPGKRRQ